MDKIKESASKFVSGGSLGAPNERDLEWLAAEQALEEERIRQAKVGKEHGGKSLYEVLQANKGEDSLAVSLKLKNQFRPLDDDEVEFLDSVAKHHREKERAIQQETSTQLESFRKLQTTVEQDPTTARLSTTSKSQEWEFSSRKRKKAQEKGGLKGIKLARTATKDSAKDSPSSPAEKAEQKSPEKAPEDEPTPKDLSKKTPTKTEATVSPASASASASSQIHTVTAAKTSLGLGGYSSDEDE